MATDPFEDLLSLEDQFYQEGYKQGTEDGVRAGRVEGRSLGLEKGFEKFLESGRLHGRAVVWANRLPNRPSLKPAMSPPTAGSGEEVGRRRGDSSHADGQESPVSPSRLPSLPNNARLEKNITTLHDLVDPESLSTENTDEAVADFDERLKKAQGKARIVEKLVGEDRKTDSSRESPGAGGSKNSNIEDIRLLPQAEAP